MQVSNDYCQAHIGSLLLLCILQTMPLTSTALVVAIWNLGPYLMRGLCLPSQGSRWCAASPV